MSNENPHAVQLLTTTYQQIATLTTERMNIDLKILAMHSKVGNILGSASQNVEASTEPAPVVEKKPVAKPMKPVAKPAPAPVAPVAVAAPAPVAPVPVPVAPAPVAEPVIAKKQEDAQSGEPLTFEEVNAMISDASTTAGGPKKLQDLMKEYNSSPYSQMSDAQKVAFGNSVKQILEVA